MSHGIPLHLLTPALTKSWMRGGDLKRMIASHIARRYRTGAGVLNAVLQLVAYVDPRGVVRDLAPPFRRYSMHDIANKPAIEECPCANFYDPEVQGPWRNRQTTEHHPVCQFDRTASRVYVRAFSEDPLNARPDALLRIREDERER